MGVKKSPPSSYFSKSWTRNMFYFLLGLIILVKKKDDVIVNKKKLQKNQAPKRMHQPHRKPSNFRSWGKDQGPSSQDSNNFRFPLVHQTPLQANICKQSITGVNFGRPWVDYHFRHIHQPQNVSSLK